MPWSAGSKSADMHPGHYPGYYYFGGRIDTGVTTLALVADTIYYVPVWLKKGTTFVGIGFETITTVASTNARIGIYTNKNGRPDSLILDAGVVALHPAAVKEVIISQKLEYDMVWLAIVCNATPTLRARSAGTRTLLFGCPTATASATTFFTEPYPYGALPASVGVLTSVPTSFPLLYLRVA